MELFNVSYGTEQLCFQLYLRKDVIDPCFVGRQSNMLLLNVILQLCITFSLSYRREERHHTRTRLHTGRGYAPECINAYTLSRKKRTCLLLAFNEVVQYQYSEKIRRPTCIVSSSLVSSNDALTLLCFIKSSLIKRIQCDSCVRKCYTYRPNYVTDLLCLNQSSFQFSLLLRGRCEVL